MTSISEAFRALVARLRWVASGRTGAAAVLQTVLARAGMLVGNLLTGVIVARTLLPQGRGEQAAISSWPTLFAGLLTLGIPLSIIYNIGGQRERAREYFSAGVVAMAALGAISGAIGAFIIPHTLSHRYSSHAIHFAQLFMAFTPLILVQYVLQATLESQGRFSVSNRLRYVPLVLTVVSLTVLAVLHRLTPFSSSLCYAVPTTILTLTAFWELRGLLPLRITRWRQTYRSLLTYGLKSYGNDLVSTFGLQIQLGLLISLLTANQLGIATVAFNVANMLNVFYSAFNIVLFPKTVARSRDEIAVMAGRSARISTGVSVLGGTVLTVIVPTFLPFLYGKSFTHAVPIAQIMTLQVLISGMVSILASAFTITGRPWIVTILQISGLAFSIPLLVLLIPRFGLFGVAFAFLMAASVRLFLVLLSYPILLKQRIPSVILTRGDIAFIRHRLVLRGNPAA
jgi:antigen flippase